MTEPATDPLKLRVVMGSCERRGAWKVPPRVEAHVMWGNMELDLRDAELGPDTTIHAFVMMGNLEIIVPNDLAVDVNVDTVAGNVEDGARLGSESDLHVSGNAEIDGEPLPTHVYREPGRAITRRLHVTGRVRFANCEVVPLRPGETRHDYAKRVRHVHRMRHMARHAERHARWRELHAERELWTGEPGRSWMPWWLQAQMRRRIFSWFAISFALGVAAGVRWWDVHRWWHFPIAVILLSIVSGWVSWRLTRPLIMVIKAARDIGDGKLDTRLHAGKRGEMRVLASAINDMASRIEQQIKDQRQLLAAVSHELRTPLGHMRVLVETARERNDPKVLDEIDREIVTLDDLVGRLLASSRLEFGNLDRRELDLGELVADVASSADIPPDQIEALGDCRAKVDPTLVRRALANLIDNARVHAGGAIAVRARRRGNQVAIEVDDAGPGVPKDRRADAFRAFTPSTGGGLGLGLALVSRIAVAHDGGAWIDDRPGGGARVGFTVSVTPPTTS
ncbi:MAG TPA: ATP-binding protein [Kofleriaceae bacterium]|nr:ATP-binding protein [Kofleriaceae bacterium]